MATYAGDNTEGLEGVYQTVTKKKIIILVELLFQWFSDNHIKFKKGKSRN